MIFQMYKMIANKICQTKIFDLWTPFTVEYILYQSLWRNGNKNIFCYCTKDGTLLLFKSSKWHFRLKIANAHVALPHAEFKCIRTMRWILTNWTHMNWTPRCRTALNQRSHDIAGCRGLWGNNLVTRCYGKHAVGTAAVR
jgi:hypothetical protein